MHRAPNGIPRVSVVIPVKNGERFLGEAIESVVNQEYPPHEILVIDGRSEDRTPEIARSYREVRYILQEGRGVPEALNIGIDAARGELIAFLSSDDRWTPDKLSAQVKRMSDDPDLQYTITRFRYFLEPGSVPPTFDTELLDRPLVGKIMETLVTRRSLFDEIGGLEPELLHAHDLDWYARAEDQGVPMALVDRVLLEKRVHDANLTLTATGSESNRELLRALRRSVQRKRVTDPRS